MSSASSEMGILILAGFLLSIFAATVSMVVVYFVWIRRMNQRIVEMQLTLFKLASFLQKKTGSSPAPAPGEPQRIEMSVEGRSVQIIGVGGRETVRFEETLSESERTRILAYLKDEGFIS